MSTTKPMRVVVFVSGLSAGGSERVAVRASEWMRDAGHDVHLLTLAAADTDFYPTPTGVTRVGLGLLQPSGGSWEAIRNNWRRIVGVRSFLKDNRPDVVVALADQTNVTMLLASIGIKCRKLISERNDPILWKPPLVWRILRRLTYSMATLHISQSEHASEWIAKRFPRLRSVVIGNTYGDLPAVALPVRHRDDAGVAALKIVAVSRLAHEKGVDLLLEAFAMARARMGAAELVIFGRGDQRQMLEAKAEALELGASVSFAGAVSNVFEQLVAADIFVLPSRFEGFPNVMVEALAAGLPIIAARCPGGTADILGAVPERYALEFPPGDVGSLADALVRLANSPDLRRALGEAALQRAADYAPAAIAAQWLSALEDNGLTIAASSTDATAT